MRCPHCSHRLVQKSEGKAKLRVPILVFSDDGASCVAPCPRCKEEITMPITIQKSALGSDEPRLVIHRNRLTR